MEDDKIQDIEMGDEQPKINTYKEQDKAMPPVDPQKQAQVNPAGPPPPVAPAQPQAAQTPPPPAQAPKPQTPGAAPIKPVDQAKRKRAIMGCFGGFFAIVIILLIFSFIFIAGATAESQNPIARLLGLNQASFVNGLITFIHIIFLLSALLVFVLTMVGLLKASTAKKDDKESKKQGIRLSLFSGISLLILLIVWMFVFVYLDTKRIRTAAPILAPIITTPVETLNLTAPVAIKFDASNVPVNSSQFNIISYQWEFGDNDTGTGQIVSHNYKTKGDGRYDVILLVTRKDKETGEEFEDAYSALITIANQALTATFIADPVKGEVPLDVKFDATDSADPDGEIVAFEWDFDEDGEFDDATGFETEYEFEQIGKYTVALRVTNSTGDFAIEEVEIEVVESELPEAVIEITDEPELFISGRQYIFKGDESFSVNGKIEEYEWDFGDGTATVSTKTASHTFENDGTYTVSLLVIDEEGKEGEVEKEISVGLAQGSPDAKISTTPSSLKGTVPFSVTFDASDSTDPDNNIVDYHWDFDGDGEADNFGKLASFTFDDTGLFPVELTVIDADGNEDNESVTIEVGEQGIIPDLSVNTNEGNVPLTVRFDASGSTYANGQITSYKWDFGDGTKPKLGAAKINHKFDEIGTYTTIVEVIGSDNNSSTEEILITVREIPLFACFVSVFEDGPAPLKTVFDPGCSTGTISNYFWDFGDGSTSSSLKPNHTFDDPGAYKVILEVSDSENTVDRAELDITVTAQ